MDTLRSMALFAKVAETGSFKQAAEEMNYSNSLISKDIAKLEQIVGARLLQRSTRKIQLIRMHFWAQAIFPTCFQNTICFFGSKKSFFTKNIAIIC